MDPRYRYVGFSQQEQWLPEKGSFYLLCLFDRDFAECNGVSYQQAVSGVALAGKDEHNRTVNHMVEVYSYSDSVFRKTKKGFLKFHTTYEKQNIDSGKLGLERTFGLEDFLDGSVCDYLDIYCGDNDRDGYMYRFSPKLIDRLFIVTREERIDDMLLQREKEIVRPVHVIGWTGRSKRIIAMDYEQNHH
ncbi:hypothetical protein HQ545_05165 [Candidatus Woesearchaeota archaeon]|nr:hypothetical protein [Candidatus Woesearchaeota archaeon]